MRARQRRRRLAMSRGSWRGCCGSRQQGLGAPLSCQVRAKEWGPWHGSGLRGQGIMLSCQVGGLGANPNMQNESVSIPPQDTLPICSFLFAGPVAHFCAQRSDQGWGCGWRNIQIMASHLLLRGPGAGGTEAGSGGLEGGIGAALFGGAGFVPDIGGSGRGGGVVSEDGEWVGRWSFLTICQPIPHPLQIPQSLQIPHPLQIPHSLAVR